MCAARCLIEIFNRSSFANVRFLVLQLLLLVKHHVSLVGLAIVDSVIVAALTLCFDVPQEIFVLLTAVELLTKLFLR